MNVQIKASDIRKSLLLCVRDNMERYKPRCALYTPYINWYKMLQVKKRKKKLNFLVTF